MKKRPYINAPLELRRTAERAPMLKAIVMNAEHRLSATRPRSRSDSVAGRPLELISIA